MVGTVLTLMGVVAVVLVVMVIMLLLTHTPTRRAYAELWSMRLREIKEKRT